MRRGGYNSFLCIVLDPETIGRFFLEQEKEFSKDILPVVHVNNKKKSSEFLIVFLCLFFKIIIKINYLTIIEDIGYNIPDS